MRFYNFFHWLLAGFSVTPDGSSPVMPDGSSPVMPDLIGHLIPVPSNREPRPAKKNGPNPVA